MTPLLEDYAVKHGYMVLERYQTSGEGHSNLRARVQHLVTGEIHYLYYDRSHKYRKKCIKCKHKIGEHTSSGCKAGAYSCGCPFFINRVARGWRNTTLDNRKARLRRK